MPEELTYVYAVGTRIPHGVFADLRGIGGHPVRLVDAADLQAVVGSVGATEFTPDRIESNMQDLDWISATARAHHHVVDTVGGQAVVAPFALATVYLDDDRVARVLRERHDAFATVLDRLQGRAEWGLKAWAPASSPRAGTGRAESGAEYLRRRRAVVREAESETGAAFEAADVLHATVAGVADAARRHRLHEPALSGRPESMVLNGAYLVESGRTTAWRAEVERAAAGSGLAVEVTGPWVPYSFAEAGER